MMWSAIVEFDPAFSMPYNSGKANMDDFPEPRAAHDRDLIHKNQSKLR